MDPSIQHMIFQQILQGLTAKTDKSKYVVNHKHEKNISHSSHSDFVWRGPFIERNVETLQQSP